MHYLITGYLLAWAHASTAFSTCLFRSLPGKRTWPQCASEMAAPWSGMGCPLSTFDKANRLPAAALSLSLSLSLSIPARSRRAQRDSETFKQSQRPAKASPLRRPFSGTQTPRLTIYHIAHSVYKLYYIWYILYVLHVAWAAIKITPLFVHFWNAHAIWILSPQQLNKTFCMIFFFFCFFSLFTFDHNSKKCPRKVQQQTQKNVTSTGDINLHKRGSIPFHVSVSSFGIG